MIKSVVIFRRRPGMSVEDFGRYWQTTHAALVSRLPGLRRYVQSQTLESAYRKFTPACDGVAELWFDGSDALRALAGTAEYAAVLADEANFIDPASRLEILTDDVKCAHGATTGQLDEDMLFYLLSRGIDRATARGLLTFAFAEDVIAKLAIPTLRRSLEERVVRGLPDAELIREFV